MINGYVGWRPLLGGFPSAFVLAHYRHDMSNKPSSCVPLSLQSSRRPRTNLRLTNRYLAQTWDETYLPPTHPLVQRKRRFDPSPSVLNTINVFVLLDLLGHKSPRLHSFYRETDWLFALMDSADRRLKAEKLVEVEHGEETWFVEQKLRKGMIGDDHVPVSRVWAGCRCAVWTLCEEVKGQRRSGKGGLL